MQLDLSEEFKNYKEDSRVAKAFLDRYIKEHEFFKKNNKKASSSNNNEIRPATPKQINFAEILAKSIMSSSLKIIKVISKCVGILSMSIVRSSK